MERFRVTLSSSLWTLAWPPHAYKGHCPFGRPARRHSRMRVQLMASARHAIDSRDASLLPMPYGHVRLYNHMTRRPSRLYYLWFHVELLYCTCSSSINFLGCPIAPAATSASTNHFSMTTTKKPLKLNTCTHAISYIPFSFMDVCSLRNG